MKGWHKDSYRHYLASKGVKTNRYLMAKPIILEKYNSKLALAHKASNPLDKLDKMEDAKEFVESQIDKSLRKGDITEKDKDSIITVAGKEYDQVYDEVTSHPKEKMAYEGTMVKAEPGFFLARKRYFADEDVKEIGEVEKEVSSAINRRKSKKLVCDTCGLEVKEYDYKGQGECEGCFSGQMTEAKEKNVMGLPKTEDVRLFDFDKAMKSKKDSGLWDWKDEKPTKQFILQYTQNDEHN